MCGCVVNDNADGDADDMMKMRTQQIKCRKSYWVRLLDLGLSSSSASESSLSSLCRVKGDDGPATAGVGAWTGRGAGDWTGRIAGTGCGCTGTGAILFVTSSRELRNSDAWRDSNHCTATGAADSRVAFSGVAGGSRGCSMFSSSWRRSWSSTDGSS